MASPRRAAGLRARDSDCTTLIRRIGGKDKRAFATFYDGTSGLIYGLLLSMLGNSGAAEAALGSIYKEVGAGDGACEVGREGPLVWLIMMTYRHACARYGGSVEVEPESGSRRRTVERSHNAVTKTVANIPEGQRFVRSALDALSPAERQMIELVFFSCLSREEIAARLGLPVQSLEDGLRTGISKLWRIVHIPANSTRHQTD